MSKHLTALFNSTRATFNRGLNQKFNFISQSRPMSTVFGVKDNVEVQKPINLKPSKHTDDLSIARSEIMVRSNELDQRDILFKRSGSERILAGDLLQVEFYRNLTKSTVGKFSGICLAIKRSGPTTTITLRNIILKVGVEMQFKVFSPMIKSITRIRKAEGFRRVKLYYLRDQPKKARLGQAKS